MPALALLTSCATSTPQYIAKNSYPVLEMPCTTRTLRSAANATPFTRARAFYGNYGGPGNQGGKPVDQMDEFFYRHDLVYMQGTRFRQLRDSDLELADQLEEIDPKKLAPQAAAFRNRSISYMRGFFGYITKPLDVVMGLRPGPRVIIEQSGCSKQVIEPCE